MIPYIVCIVLGYACGCFSTAYFISKAKGFDIRDYGTGNAGASNIKIKLGWKYGILVAVIDIFKGWLAATIAAYLFPEVACASALAGMAAVCGHMYPFYMKFRGGKGLATYTGASLALNWKFTLIIIVVCVILTVVSNYIITGTYTMITAMPIYHGIILSHHLIAGILLAVSLIIGYKHLINIKRIIKGTETGLRAKKA